jgi:hypothetical protein
MFASICRLQHDETDGTDIMISKNLILNDFDLGMRGIQLPQFGANLLSFS